MRSALKNLVSHIFEHYAGRRMGQKRVIEHGYTKSVILHFYGTIEVVEKLNFQLAMVQSCQGSDMNKYEEIWL